MNDAAGFIEDTLHHSLSLLEHPTPDAVAECARRLEPCLEQMAAWRSAVAAGGLSRAEARELLERIRGQLRRLSALARHAVEFQVGCAFAGLAQAPGYSPRGSSLPDLPLRRWKMEG